MRGGWWLAACVALGCSGGGNALPPAPATDVVTDSVRTFCNVALRAPEAFAVTLHADDVRGIDCVPPAGGEVFSLGFAHAGWWLQLDVARSSLVVGAAHAFDGQAALLALDCWSWDGAVTVDEDDAAHWSLTIDAQCRDDVDKVIDGTFDGER
ncbi:MAG TPA: hypothetical protein VGL86_23965 [Polyangia bacterium]